MFSEFYKNMAQSQNQTIWFLSDDYVGGEISGTKLMG